MSKNPDEIFCVYCGERIKKQAEICPSCGVRNRQDVFPDSKEMYCFSCGEEIKTKAEICPNCGVKNTPGVTSQTASDISYSFDDSQKILEILTSGLGIFLIIASIGALSEGDIIAGVLILSIGVGLLPQVRNHINREHPITTIGYVSSVNEVNLDTSDEVCTICYNSAKEGKQRVYTKKFVFLGIPIYTVDRGENVYCSSCLTEERSAKFESSEIIEAEKQS